MTASAPPPVPPPPAAPPPGPSGRQGISPGLAVGLILLTLVVVAGAVVGVIVFTGDEDPVPSAPIRTEPITAGCGDVVEQPATLDPVHLSPGETLPQTERPATSGPHAAATVSPGLYADPVDEAQVVHNLEHGYVAIWYDPAAVGQDVIDALAAAAEGQRVVMSPYGDLQGDGIAFVSWERTQRCPAGVDAGAAGETAVAYIATFVDAPNAPEAGVA